MSVSKVTGNVAVVLEKNGRDHFNIALDNADLDGNWYYGEEDVTNYVDTVPAKGDKVRLEVDDNKGGITGISFIGVPKNDVKGSGANEDEETRGSDVTDQQDSSIGGSTGSDNSYVPPELQVALKEAAETARARSEVQNTEQHVETVENLTGEYYRILKKNGEVKG